MPNHSIMALRELYAHLNIPYFKYMQTRALYPIYYEAQGWPPKINPYKKKAYILYKNILFYYLLFFIHSIHAEEILLLDNSWCCNEKAMNQQKNILNVCSYKLASFSSYTLLVLFQNRPSNCCILFIPFTNFPLLIRSLINSFQKSFLFNLIKIFQLDI